MKAKIILIALIICSITPIFAGASLEFIKPTKSEFVEGETVPFKIKIMSQFNIFGNNDSRRYYFRGRADTATCNPFYHCHRNNSSKKHNGIDISFSKDGLTPSRQIVAAECGIITECYFEDPADTSFGYGLSLIIYYPSINKTVRYSHLKPSSYPTSGFKCQNEIIAYGGHSGNVPDTTKNLHVHVEIADSFCDTRYLFNTHRENPASCLFGESLDSLTFSL
jgi:hypothetical protein